MKRLASSFFLCVLLSFSVFLLSCEKDSYEKGEGRYSLLQADFTYLTINSEILSIAPSYIIIRWKATRLT